MSTTEKATPGPWHVERCGETRPTEYLLVSVLEKDPARGDTIRTIGRCFDYGGQAESHANAELIVRAVNAHDALVALARAVIEDAGPNVDLILQARQALKLAEEE